MNTPRQTAGTWLALIALAVVGHGCGANLVATAEQPEASPAPVVADTNAALDATGVAGVPAPDTNAPPVLQSDRALPPLRPEIAEVVELIDSGAGEEVVRAFVSVSPVAYELTLDEIIYLRDIGIPDTVIAAMMRRGAELRAQQEDAAALQTNLVSAVEQLKDAFASATPQPVATSAPPAETTAPSAEPPPAVAASEPPPEAPEEVQQFYSDLSPYGNWYQVPTYGWVWQPSVVVVNPLWVPYRHGGRWLWTDWGWYWCSDYSWGWAPFHYGRWCTYPGLGWCWVPGRVWGPSWVTWRYTAGHVGWAPLPPACGWSSGIGLTWYGSKVGVSFGFGLPATCFTFVAFKDFCHRNVGHHAVKGPRAGEVFKESTVINNVIRGDNNVIINNGVGYTTVASHVRGEVPKANIEPLPAQADRPLRADRIERTERGTVIYKPTRVEGPAGRPVALRAETGPTRGSLARTTTVPPRATYGSRFDGANLPGKAVESRGPEQRAVGRQSAPATARPLAPSVNGRSPALSRDNWQPTIPTTPKAVESRGVTTPNRSRVTTTTPGTTLTPQRQTLPVPLADPSRNIPSRLNQPAPRVQTPVVPNKPAYENRGTTVVPATPRYQPAPSLSRPQSAPTMIRPTTPSVTPTPRAVTPAPRAVTPAPRTVTPPPPKTSYQRSVAPTTRAPAPSARTYVRPSYTPAPAMARPTVSAPSPSVRPTVSRPVMSAPASARMAPSRPAAAAPRRPN